MKEKHYWMPDENDPTWLVPIKYTVFVNTNNMDLEQIYDVYRKLHSWCLDNCCYKFEGIPIGHWQFEDKDDATLFKLTWL